MVPVDSLLKTRQVAEAMGVGVSTIKRWVDSGTLEAARTRGKHRLIRLSEALRFARQQGLPSANLELLLGTGAARVDRINDQIRSSLLEALTAGNARAARTLIRSVHASGHGGIAIADDLIRPVMEQIGHAWMIGAVDVYQEHQATQIVAASLLELTEPLTQIQEPLRPLALGAAIADDPYVLPGLLGEIVLREEGWAVRNLGPNLPTTSLASALHAYRPRMVFISVSYLGKGGEDRFVREYTSFYEAAARCGAAVIVGGRALGPELRARLVFASFGERMVHLAEFARRLLIGEENRCTLPG